MPETKNNNDEPERIYVVLELLEDVELDGVQTPLFTELTRMPARNAEHALRQVFEQLYADRDPDVPLTLVGVPERNWRPKTVAHTTRLAVTIG